MTSVGSASRPASVVSSRARPRANEGGVVLRLRVCGHGGSGFLGGLRDRSSASRPGRPPRAAPSDHGPGHRSDRPRHPQLLAAGPRLSGGRRFSRGSGPGIRCGVVVLADRCLGSGLRAHDRDLHRRCGKRADRAGARDRRSADPDRPRACGGRGGLDLVWTRWPSRLRADDDPVSLASIPVLALGWVEPHQAHGAAPLTHAASPALVAVILAFPVAMALATGTEAPATSIAQLGQLGNRERRRFGRGTLALTIFIVGGLTLGLTALAVHLHVGIPPHDQTEISELARAATGSGGLFGFFQLSSGLLLLAAAASSFQAGPGTSEGARSHRARRRRRPAARATRSHELAPHAGRGGRRVRRDLGRDHPGGKRQGAGAGAGLCGRRLCQLPGGPPGDGALLAPARLGLLTATNVVGAAAVAFTLIVNLQRGYPLLALAGTVFVAAVLYWRWFRAGRPRGIEAVEREAEADF